MRLTLRRTGDIFFKVLMKLTILLLSFYCSFVLHLIFQVRRSSPLKMSGCKKSLKLTNIHCDMVVFLVIRFIKYLFAKTNVQQCPVSFSETTKADGKKVHVRAIKLKTFCCPFRSRNKGVFIDLKFGLMLNMVSYPITRPNPRQKTQTRIGILKY